MTPRVLFLIMLYSIFIYAFLSTIIIVLAVTDTLPSLWEWYILLAAKEISLISAMFSLGSYSSNKEIHG